MLTQDDIIVFCNQNNYDIRETGNGRWIDQKCTPDVIWSIADFILEYVDNVNTTFTVREIWGSDYAKQTIAETFSKPGTDEMTAENEYDKVFSQPLSMFCYAGIIEDLSDDRRHIYKVVNREVLEYIARNDANALRFLCCYIEKVMRDSDLYTPFQSFFDNQDINHFAALKQSFIDFYHKYTPIKGDYEPKRIFAKVLNPLAYKYDKKGTTRGRMSSDIIKKADMMYNRDNFRDVYLDKPKGVSRQDWLVQNPKIVRRIGYFQQMMNREKKTLREHIRDTRNGVSELTQFVKEHNDNAYPSQVHHIFPRNEFPDIEHLIENLIALTPNQHYSFAHPNNQTQMVDLEAQKTLLIAKTLSIQENLTNEIEPIYEFKNLLTVLSIGWDDKSVYEINDYDYCDVIMCINDHYNTL